MSAPKKSSENVICAPARSAATLGAAGGQVGMLKTDPGIELLNDAVARGAAAVISLPADRELHHHKTRFLGRDGAGLWLESIAGHSIQIEALIDAGVPVGVSFRGDPHRVAFCSRILRRENEFHINDACAVQALLLAFPDQVTSIQRRAAYRVAVPLESELRLRGLLD